MNKPVKLDELPLEPTPTQRRKMLIAGVEDFDNKMKPETAEEAVDTFLAKSTVVLAQAAPRSLAEPDDRFDWHRDTDCVILHEQPATAVYFGGGGHLVIRQTNGYEDDITILIAPQNITEFLEATAKKAREI